MLPALSGERKSLCLYEQTCSPWADFGGFHALVIVQITATDVALLDPALEDGGLNLSALL